MLPMVIMPAPSSPLTDYNSLGRRFTMQRSPSVPDSGVQPPLVGEDALRSTCSASPTQRRRSNLYRTIQRRVSHTSLNSDNSGPSSLAKASQRNKHRMSFRGVNVVATDHPRDAAQRSTSSGRLWPFNRPRVPDNQPDDVFHDAINNEIGRSATSSPYMRPSTTLSLPHSSLWRDANNSSPIIPLGIDTPPMRSMSPMPTSSRRPLHQLSNNVVLVVEPMHQVLHMFGALQVTGSYSLSGTLRVSLPHAMDECRDIHLRSLQVRLCGYSLYIDHIGRYSCMRLCDIKQDVIAAPIQLALPPHGASMYETEYDMFVPGWLPASISTRAVSTFYKLEAVAELCDMCTSSSLTRSGHSVRVCSPPSLVVIQRSREIVPIPVAQTAAFLGPDVPLTRNPFRRETNPFRVVEPEAQTPPMPRPMPRPMPPPKRSRTSRAQLRHYTHLAHLHLPVPVMMNGKTHATLPVKLCLSVPSYSSTHAVSHEDQPPLIFWLQVELDPAWQGAKGWSDVRVREMEAVCVQMEKYSTTLSRSYCTAFALGDDDNSFVAPDELPYFDNLPSDTGVYTPQSALAASNAPPQPYSVQLAENRKHMELTCTQPNERHNTIERFRAYTVGPLPSREKQSEKEREPQVHGKPATFTTPKSRRTVTNALSRLSIFSPHREASTTADHAAEPEASSSAHDAGSNAGSVENTKASYVLEGEDGGGLALNQKRVRLSFSLPLVPSCGSMAIKYNAPQLLPDYESPHMRIRHKLKVKVRFAFEGPDLPPHAGMQSVVMSVPVRFSEAPPMVALSQAPPLVLPKSAHSYVPSEGAANAALPPAYVCASYSSNGSAQSRQYSGYLPAYAQLFREDGSRLEDDAEVLPPYPEQQKTRMTVPLEEQRENERFSAYLERQLRLVPSAERERKTPAAISLVDALNAHDDEQLMGMAEAMDEEMMDERLGEEMVAYDDYEDMPRSERPATMSPGLDVSAAAPPASPTEAAVPVAAPALPLAQPAIPMASLMYLSPPRANGTTWSAV